MVYFSYLLNYYSQVSFNLEISLCVAKIIQITMTAGLLLTATSRFLKSFFSRTKVIFKFYIQVGKRKNNAFLSSRTRKK